MNRTTVYVKGDPGFKPAIITRLGRDWIQHCQDIDDVFISFSLPEEMSVEEFKTSIGTGVISTFEVLFFNEIPTSTEPAPWKFIPGRPFEMSIWANSDSNLGTTKTAEHGKEK